MKPAEPGRLHTFKALQKQKKLLEEQWVPESIPAMRLTKPGGKS